MDTDQQVGIFCCSCSTVHLLHIESRHLCIRIHICQHDPLHIKPCTRTMSYQPCCQVQALRT